ncbi:hypothetical protein ACQKQD_32565 [Methylobacterium sp. NPDC080182]|uniref:hypothetical protein n=1 Tax=Methylobacterium sp. NPDC080182 TaxID=3390590 RepID=UPI003D0751EF
MSQARHPHRTRRVSGSMVPTVSATPEPDDPVMVLRRAVIGARLRRPAATVALLAELAFPNHDDHRR